MRKYKLLTLLVACIMLIAACGSGEIIDNDYPIDTEAEYESIPTLSIFAPEFYRYVINQAVRHMSLAGEGRISLELTTYAPEAREAHLTRLQTQFMAGDAPDMFFLDGHPLHAYIQSGFLTDIHELMDACSRTNRDDFFTEPLNAMVMYDGLYAFPMSFGFSHVLINASLPQPIIDRFDQHDTITITALMALYSDLMRDYDDEFGHLSFSGGNSLIGTNPQVIFKYYMDYFVDFENKSIDLTDSHFIDFLDLFYPIFNERWLGNYSYSFSLLSDLRTLQDRANEHVFWIATSHMRNSAFGLYSGQTLFLHSVPLADTYSNLIIGAGVEGMGDTWATVCITAADNRQLAWGFTQHLMTAFNEPNQFATYHFIWDSSIASPISRSSFLPRMTNAFDTFIDNISGLARQGYATLDRSEMPEVISRVAALNEMPMALSYSLLPESLYLDLLDQFMLGAIASDAFAHQLQNRVSLWLIE